MRQPDFVLNLVDHSTANLLALFFVGLFFSGVFSMLEAAIISQDRHRLSHLAESGDKNAAIMRNLLARRIEKLLAAILLCNNLANVSCAASATALLSHWMGLAEGGLLAVTLTVTFILLVFGEITPKVIGVRHGQRIALASARVMRVLLWVLAPVIFITQKLAAGILFVLSGGKPLPAPDIAMNARELRSVIRMAGQAQSDGGEKNPHYQMVETTLLFNELPVEKIMTPRPEIIGIDLDSDEMALARAVLKSRSAKLPIYRGALDKATAFIHCQSAIQHIRHGRLSAQRLEKIAHKIYFAPAAAPALSQLQNMRQKNSPLALVIDGSGWVVGLLTFTNFAAAIIGEKETAKIGRQGDAFKVAADMSVTQFGIEAGRTLPDTQASNLNGMVLEYLGDMPSAPVCLVMDGWRIEILKFNEQAIETLLITPPDERAD